jgi:Flp pilus assembly protein TadB
MHHGGDQGGDAMRRDPSDPTRVTEQPALTTSSGRLWMIVGTLFAIVALVVLGFLTTVQPVVALTGCVLVVALYIAMLIVRLRVPAQRSRLVALAWLLATMAAISLICVLIIAGSVRPVG